MNTFIDTLVLVAFILFMIAIFSGYNKSRMLDKQKEEALESDQNKEENK